MFLLICCASKKRQVRPKFLFDSQIGSQANSYTVGFRQLKTALYDWTSFRLSSSVPPSHRQSSRFYSSGAPSGGGWCEGVLLYGSQKSAGSSALRAFSASNACFARDEPASKRIGGVGFSRKPPKLRSWHCTQPRAAKATAGVSVVGKMTSIPRAAAIVVNALLMSGARSAPR